MKRRLPVGVGVAILITLVASSLILLGLPQLQAGGRIASVGIAIRGNAVFLAVEVELHGRVQLAYLSLFRDGKMLDTTTISRSGVVFLRLSEPFVCPLPGRYEVLLEGYDWRDHWVKEFNGFNVTASACLSGNTLILDWENSGDLPALVADVVFMSVACCLHGNFKNALVLREGRSGVFYLDLDLPNMTIVQAHVFLKDGKDMTVWEGAVTPCQQ